MKILFLLGFLVSSHSFANYEISDEAVQVTRNEDKRVRSEIEQKIYEINAQSFVSGEDKLNEFIEWLKNQYNVGQDLEDLKIYGEVVFISYCRSDVLQYSEAMAAVSKIIVSHSARVACMITPETLPFAEGCFILGRVLGDVGGKYLGMQIYPFVKSSLCN